MWRGRGGFIHQRFAQQIATDIGFQAVTVKNLLDAVGLDGAGQAKLERPAPGVGDEVAAHIARAFADDRQEAEVVDLCGS